jgi:hypothetical protein
MFALDLLNPFFRHPQITFDLLLDLSSPIVDQEINAPLVF